MVATEPDLRVGLGVLVDVEVDDGAVMRGVVGHDDVAGVPGGGPEVEGLVFIGLGIGVDGRKADVVAGEPVGDQVGRPDIGVADGVQSRGEVVWR